MKKLKTFESYLSDKMITIKDKFNKLKKIIDFIKKYKLKYFIISDETSSGSYLFEDISKEHGDYFLTYYSYQGKESTSHKTELTELPYDVVDELITLCENDGRFSIEFHLESFADIEMFINVIKAHKGPIEFTQWMFGMFVENDDQDKANTFKFQDLLFKNHPESFNIFMDECVESEKVSVGKDWEPLKIAPGIEQKYKNLFDDYEVHKSSKKYNL